MTISKKKTEINFYTNVSFKYIKLATDTIQVNPEWYEPFKKITFIDVNHRLVVADGHTILYSTHEDHEQQQLKDLEHQYPGCKVLFTERFKKL